MANLTVYDQFPQNSDLWFLARLGLPTASCFKLIMSKGVGQKESVRRSDYLHDLLAELKRGEPVAPYKYRNPYMDRGHLWEPEALASYLQNIDEPVTTPAFIRNNALMCGCSPDALIGELGGVEIKTLLPGLMMRHLRGPSADAHMAQLQGSMMVTGREWWDLVHYCPGDIDVIRVGRDDKYIDEFRTFLAPFMLELEKAVLEVTHGSYTLKGLRELRDKQFAERLAEELESPLSEINLAKVAEDLRTPSASKITEALRQSLMVEDEE